MATKKIDQAAALKAFQARLARQRTARKDQLRQQARDRLSTRVAPVADEDQPRGRDWASAVDRDGRVKIW
jgi:hypothetical protein